MSDFAIPSLARSALLLGLAALASMLPAPAAAQRAARAGNDGGGAPGVRVMRAVRRAGPIAVDGRLDEPAWRDAEVAGRFTQSYPDPGAPPPDPTEVRVLYDDDALYVGVRMFDAHPDSIAAQLARRDASGIYSDWVHLIVDSYHDRRTAFRFTVNPRGVEKDVYTSNDGNEDLNWDAVWSVGARVDSLGWVAEYRIPLSQLRFGAAPADGDRTWGIQVMRDIARRNERDSWSPWTPKSPGFVSAFGDLRGLRGVPAPKRLEILPYVSSKVTRSHGDETNPFFHHTDASPSVGADVRLGLPGGLTLTGTVNPDFGQVEVDPAVVNLSAFETFFPEKRPFFLEGGDVFNFGQVRRQNDYGQQFFFYSRRIGRAPEVGPTAPPGDFIRFADAPEQTRIAGAAKVTGKSGPWTIGVLDAVTTEADARVALASGGVAEAPVEPLTNYLAARAKRDFDHGASFVGAMLTSTTRSMDDAVFRPLLRSGATLAGVDFEHGMRRRTWILSGFLAETRVSGSPEAVGRTQRNSTHYFQRPDASYLTYDPSRTSLAGYAGEIALQKSGSVFGSLAYKELDPGFELNDLGFVGRVDYRALSSLVGYQSFKAGKHLRSYSAFAYANDTWNFGGRPIYRGLAASGNATFNNLWSVFGGVTRSLSAYDDRRLRGGPIATQPAGWSYNLSVNSDSRWPVVVSAFGFHHDDDAGDRAGSYGLSFDARPTSTLHVTFTPSLDVSRGTAQYVAAFDDATAEATFGRRYVFADIRQTTLSLETRVDWTLSTTLSLQTFVQPFVASGDYSGFKEFTTPGLREFAVYGGDRGSIAHDPGSDTYTVDPDGPGPAQPFTLRDPDFNLRSVRGNAVLRWEYRPGSALYLVWQQQRSAFVARGDFDTGRDVGALFDAVPTNVFLIKATYWIGH